MKIINDKTSLIQKARIKRKAEIMHYLIEAFKGFDCPVYLFGSYATEKFHGNSDVDILIVTPEQLKDKHYRAACNRMSALDMDYDILVTDSMARLDQSIINSLQIVSLQPSQIQSKVMVSRNQGGMALIRHDRIIDWHVSSTLDLTNF
ncbi:MAG: nucleotidyltransferase domain-containing protein [Methylovulum sp.]|nr:MAG: nucleotidyltransferase domain-containing protein [Methylovulum sp.]